MPKPTIGFIGLGDMGEPMAARLLEKGYSVLSCVHRRREAIERLKEKGIVEKADPRHVAGEADVVMSIVIDRSRLRTPSEAPKGGAGGHAPRCGSNPDEHSCSDLLSDTCA
jgi:3-hydroxyisobutyrate dehydrogenase-like beta-hydroxyacid dehydrogenase